MSSNLLRRIVIDQFFSWCNDNYHRTIKNCKICGKQFTFSRHYHETCSQDCKIAYRKHTIKLWWKKNREKAREYYLKNKEKNNAATRAWQLRNPDRVKATIKRYKDSHKELLHKKWSAYYAANKERLLAKHHVYYRQNKEHYLDLAKKNYAKNRTRLDELHRVSQRTLYAQRKDMLFDILGGAKCARCRFSDTRALQFDHINGGGHRERKQTEPHSWLRYYVNHPEEARKKLQVLCANCNQIKRYENGEFAKPKKSP